MTEENIVISCNNLEEKYRFNKVAKQASGAVMYQCGDAVLLAAIAVDPDPVDEDFLPLTVQYIEKAYAAAKIPGGFIKRETKPGDFETLTSRIVDRSIRPLFPAGFNYPVVLTITVLSADPLIDMQIAAMHAASAALYTSDIDVHQAVSAVRLGKIEDEVLINPTLIEQEESTLDLLVVGSGSDVLMIEMCVHASENAEKESTANELDEEELLEIIDIAQSAIEQATNEYESGFKVAKKEVIGLDLFEEKEDQELYDFIQQNYAEAVSSAVQSMAKSERSQALSDVCETIVAYLRNEGKEVDEALVERMLEAYKKSVVRSLVLEKSTRVDGRALNEVRAIDIETNLLPSVHGSCLFTRGQTQALVTATIGDSKDAQSYDMIGSKSALYENFMVHYNFPGFSVGEAKPAKAPGRRELGHGNLGKRGLEATLGANYNGTVRLVSEILESNGSSSMATVCGGSLALKAAKIETSNLVAGIAMGLVKEEDKYCVLSDIMGLEDHDGDMDFKITGTKEGITAMQMDIKLGGIEVDILKDTLFQAKEGRLHILSIMEEALTEMQPSTALPSSLTFDIQASHIPAIIGKGGSTIREIIEKYNVSIDIDRDSNSVKVTGSSEGIEDAKKYIEAIISTPAKKQMTYEINKQYTGKVKKMVEFGIFVEMPDGYDALLHISKVAKERVESLDGIYSIGDEIDIIVLEQKGKKVELCTPAYIL